MATKCVVCIQNLLCCCCFFVALALLLLIRDTKQSTRQMEFHCWGKCNVVIDILRDGTNNRDRDQQSPLHRAQWWKEKKCMGTQAPMFIWMQTKKKKKKWTLCEAIKKEWKTARKKNRSSSRHKLKLLSKQSSRWCCVFFSYTLQTLSEASFKQQRQFIFESKKRRRMKHVINTHTHTHIDQNCQEIAWAFPFNSFQF